MKLTEWCREHHKILILTDDGIRLDYYHPEDAKDAFAGLCRCSFWRPTWR